MAGEDYEAGGEIIPADSTAVEPATESLPAGFEGFDVGLVNDWESSGGAPFHLEQAQSVAAAVLNELGPNDRLAVEGTFDALPQGAQTAIVAEIALPSGGSAQSATPEALADFAGTDEGAILVPFWKGRAAKKPGPSASARCPHRGCDDGSGAQGGLGVFQLASVARQNCRSFPAVGMTMMPVVGRDSTFPRRHRR